MPEPFACCLTMFSCRPYYTPNLFSIQFSIGAHVCEDERCKAVHGWVMSLQFSWWGFEIEYMRRS